MDLRGKWLELQLGLDRGVPQEHASEGASMIRVRSTPAPSCLISYNVALPYQGFSD